MARDEPKAEVQEELVPDLGLGQGQSRDQGRDQGQGHIDTSRRVHIRDHVIIYQQVDHVNAVQLDLDSATARNETTNVHDFLAQAGASEVTGHQFVKAQELAVRVQMAIGKSLERAPLSRTTTIRHRSRIFRPRRFQSTTLKIKMYQILFINFIYILLLILSVVLKK